jgi:hypothetical protein
MNEIVPIFINNRNRLSTTRGLIEYLQNVPDALPIIVDNASTYPPLLEWYDHCHVEVVYAERNLGPRAPWLLRHFMMTRYPYYVVTDSDLSLMNVPGDVLDMLRSGLEQYPDLVKAGLSLETCDLPQHLQSTLMIQKWEDQFWKKRIEARWWKADVDTTFALYRRGAEWPGIRPALRSDRPYTARHVPWYRIESEEERYYEEHADPKWATWANWDKPIETQPARKHHVDTLRRMKHER